jgi:very-short-patch-repair endonuclease
MPRFSTGRTKVATAERARRAAGYRVSGYKRWIDPFPTIHGTVPEKMVYAALSFRGIRFYFLNNVHIAIPEVDLFQIYQADFILPDQKIIIEVQGSYWHSTPSAIESDAFKYAMYDYAGYKTLPWWDYDILDNLNNLFAQTPELAGFQSSRTGSAELAPLDRTKVDTSQGIRTLNYQRAQRQAYKKSPVRTRSGYVARTR